MANDNDVDKIADKVVGKIILKIIVFIICAIIFKWLVFLFGFFNSLIIFACAAVGIPLLFWLLIITGVGLWEQLLVPSWKKMVKWYNSLDEKIQNKINIAFAFIILNGLFLLGIMLFNFILPKKAMNPFEALVVLYVLMLLGWWGQRNEAKKNAKKNGKTIEQQKEENSDGGKS